MPTRSTSVHGPIGQPAPFRSATSSSSGVTRASSSTRTQSFNSGMRTRLTTKPGVSWQRTGVLPSRSPTANAVSTVSSDVSSARTISTSGISGAGLKKCIPTTRSGVDVAEAISVTESADVLVASTASGRTIRSSSSKSARLASSSSTIASITRSQPARSESSVVSDRRPAAAARSSAASCPFSTLRSRKCSIRPRACLAELERHLAADGLEARLDRELRDPRAHRAQPDHAHSAHQAATAADSRRPRRREAVSRASATGTRGACARHRRCASRRRGEARAARPGGRRAGRR